MQCEPARAHSRLLLSKSAAALRLTPHGQSTNTCQVTEDLGFAGQHTTKHLLQKQGQPRSKGTELASWLLLAPVPLEKGCVRQRGGRPCHQTAAAPSCSPPREWSCPSSFLHPHFTKLGLNIAKCALMSQLRAGGAATFPFRNLGRNPPELHTGEKLPCLLLWLQKDSMQDLTGLQGVLQAWPSRS